MSTVTSWSLFLTSLTSTCSCCVVQWRQQAASSPEAATQATGVSREVTTEAWCRRKPEFTGFQLQHTHWYDQSHSNWYTLWLSHPVTPQLVCSVTLRLVLVHLVTYCSRYTRSHTSPSIPSHTLTGTPSHTRTRLVQLVTALCSLTIYRQYLQSAIPASSHRR